jgi:ArsR family transcriptional regulator, arsenate/arsenite/antimonite-responsive transcriptional repressor
MSRQPAIARPSVQASPCAQDNSSGPATGTDANRTTPGIVGDADAAAGLLAAAADPVRWTVLQLLVNHQSCVCELQERIPIAPNLLSYHLKMLRDAGLVTGTRRGRWIDYRLTHGALARLHAALPTPSASDEAAASEIRTAAGCAR